ncbi:MAG TPA: alpha/beta hydrolase [Thermoanaerobaculia bacterium]|nr:alpha/beta hydrolase [Thermoanaerobaculia bacterium]
MPRPLLTAGFLAIGIVLLAAVLFAAVFVLGQNRLLYFPTRRYATTPAALGLDADDLAVVTEDGVRLEGWRIRGAGTKALLFFHGNAGNIADRLERAKMLNARFGLDVFLVDYRGYGRSQGSPSEEGLYRDARAVYRAAAAAGFRPEQIVVFGESLGAAVAVDLARSHPSAGLVLEAPFLSVPAVAHVHYPFVPTFLVQSRFDNLAKIADVAAPKLIFVPELDEVIPPSHGRRLFEAAQGARELSVVPGAHHNDAYLVGGEAYWRAWEKFLAAIP